MSDQQTPSENMEERWNRLETVIQRQADAMTELAGSIRQLADKITPQAPPVPPKPTIPTPPPIQPIQQQPPRQPYQQPPQQAQQPVQPSQAPQQPPARPVQGQTPPTAQQQQRQYQQQAQAQRVAPPQYPKPAPKPKKEIDWEWVIGSAWGRWAGVLIIIIGMGFFIQLAYTQGWLSESQRLIIASAIGIASLIFGENLRKKYAIYGQTLQGLGICILYMTVYSGFALQSVYGIYTGIALLTVVTAAAIFFAVRYTSITFVIIGLLGGYLTALMLGTKPEHASLFLAYIFMLNAALVIIAIIRKWTAVMIMKIIAAGVIFAIWRYNWLTPQYHEAAFIYLLASFIIGSLGYASLVWLTKDKLRPRAFEVLFIFALPLFYYLFIRDIIDIHLRTNVLGLITIGFALYYLVLTFATIYFSSEATKHKLVLVTVVTGFAAVAVPTFFDSAWWITFWAIEAFALVAIGKVSRDKYLRTYGWVGALLIFMYYILKDIMAPMGMNETFNYALNNPVFINGSAISAMLFGLFALVIKPDDRLDSSELSLKSLLVVLGCFTLLAASSYEVYSYGCIIYPKDAMLRQLLLSALWSVFAFVLITVGIWQRYGTVRWIGLAYLGMTITKVLFVDFASLDQLYRVISFMVVGLTLIIIAWLYTKYKESITGKKGIESVSANGTAVSEAKPEAKKDEDVKFDLP